MWLSDAQSQTETVAGTERKVVSAVGTETGAEAGQTAAEMTDRHIETGARSALSASRAGQDLIEEMRIQEMMELE